MSIVARVAGRGRAAVLAFLLGVMPLQATAQAPDAARVIAFFDRDRLNVFRLQDNQPAFPPLPLPGGGGPVSFNGAGTRLAVLQPQRVRILAATDGSELGQDEGPCADFAFRPGARHGDDRARVLPTAAGAQLALVAGNAARPPLPIPGSAGGSNYRVAWARDGSRVAVAFNAGPAPAGARLAVVEWTLEGEAAGTPATREWPLAAGEELRVFAYAGEAAEPAFVFATSQGVFRSDLDGSIAPVLPAGVLQGDMRRPGMAALVPANARSQAVLITENGLYPEPLSGTIWGIALADAAAPGHPVMAVARLAFPTAAPGLRNGVVLYRLVEQGGSARLRVDRIYPAQEPAFPAFGPRAR